MRDDGKPRERTRAKRGTPLLNTSSPPIDLRLLPTTAASPGREWRPCGTPGHRPGTASDDPRRSFYLLSLSTHASREPRTGARVGVSSGVISVVRLLTISSVWVSVDLDNWIPIDVHQSQFLIMNTESRRPTDLQEVWALYLVISWLFLVSTKLRNFRVRFIRQISVVLKERHR